MDTMIQSYMEETEDMLQRAEECIIRLEAEFSPEEINELFRIAHTIKGSSHVMGYEAIGNLMHRIEDLLDTVRNGSISFNQDIVSLCFDGLDIAKKMLQTKTESYAGEFLEEHLEEASSIGEKIQSYISANKTTVKKNKEDTTAAQEKTGIVSALMNKEPRGKNKFYITVVLEEDAPMISPVFILVLKNIENIGTLLYSSITDDCLWGADVDVRILEMILCTDIEEAELYNYFDLFYVEKINIINLNRNVNEINDYYLNETDYSPYLMILKTVMELYRMAFCSHEIKPASEAADGIKHLQSQTTEALSRLRNKAKSKAYGKEFNDLFGMIKKMLNAKTGNNKKVKAEIRERLIDFIEKMYQGIKGKYIVRYIRLEKGNAENTLKNIMGMINRSSTLIFLINISMLDILHENEIKELIRIKGELLELGVEIGLVTYGSGSRRIINIFDSIKQIDEIKVYSSELEAIFEMFKSDDSYRRLANRIDRLKYDQRGAENNTYG